MYKDKTQFLKRIVTFFLFLNLALFPSIQSEANSILLNSNIFDFFYVYDGENNGELTDDVEYWALLIAVGIYQFVPDMNRPTMLQEVADFEQVLLSSDNWDSDHIKIIKAEDATILNIYQGFKWLDSHEDENDFCLIYLTTHGFPLWWDRPPFDEADGKDEALATYTGFFPFNPVDPDRWEPMTNPFGIISDDQFNRWFNKLDSQGVGVIVDSCHSGGFDDYYSLSVNQKTDQFTMGFAAELRGQNRIIVTSVPEEDISYGSYFSHYLIKGFQGYADTNNDNQVTLEESFDYAKNKVEQWTSMHPQIFDNYPGEFVVIR